MAKNLDVFLISETKTNYSFPEAQFSSNGYGLPHRRARALGGGGLMLFVNENIPSKKLTDHILPEDIEILCAEINLKKQKWIIMGVYNPPNTNNKYVMDHLSKAVDFYSTKYDRIVIIGDFSHSYVLHTLVKENTCLKGPPKCYHLI